MNSRRSPIELVVFLYFLAYLPNVVLTRVVTAMPLAALGRPLTGLETLPAALLFNLVMTYLFIWLSGWHRDAHGRSIAGWRIPCPTRATFVSGLGTGLVLFTVPLSFTFKGVSIPFIQLLMRGDILIIAPLVDVLFGRKVRWWSWAALMMVAVALLITVTARGGMHMPALAWLDVVLYTLGYFIRLTVMTRVAKTDDPAGVRRYFVEEKIVALPLAVLALAAISASGIGGQAGALAIGFLRVWGDPVIGWLALIAVTLTIVSVFSAVILLDARENAFCVPMERAASLVAGIAGALLLARFWHQPQPSGADLVGATILIAAIVLLSLAPRWSGLGRRAPAAVV